MANTLWTRFRHRYKSHIRHSDAIIHPVALYLILAMLIIATIALICYALTVK